MIIYFFILLMSIYLMYYGEKHNIKIIVFFSILLVTLLGGLRYGIGTDYFSYQEIYNEYATNGTTAGHYIEILFCQLMRLAIVFNLPFSVFLFLIQVLINCVTFWAIYREKNKIGLWFPWAIFCFEYYILSYNMIRQSIAMAFCLLAITYFNQSKIKFLFLTILAIGFHNSAIIFIPILFLSLIYKLPKRNIIYFVVITICLFIVIKKTLIINLIARVFPVIGYAGYLIGNGSSSIFGILFKFLPVIIPLLFVINKINKNPEFELFFILFILGGVLSLLVLSGKDQIGRITFYYTMLKILLIPYSFKLYSDKYNRACFIPFSFLWTFFMFIWDFMILNNGSSVPYQFIWGQS